MSRFEAIVGNPKFFKIILDNFFDDWPGSYVVVVNDHSGSRLFEIGDKIIPFCRKVRSHPIGYDRCINCDREHTEKAAIARTPISYVCHAGLIDIAVPIMLQDAEGNHELLATILCGQRRSLDPQMEAEEIQRGSALERELGFVEGELLDLRTDIATLKTEDLDSIKEQLWEVAQYISDLGSQKLEAEKAKQQLIYRLRETREIQNVLLELSEVVDNVDLFWSRLGAVMTNICRIIGSICSVFVVCEPSDASTSIKGTIRAVTNLPESLLKKQYLACDLHLLAASHSMRPTLITMPDDVGANRLLIDILGCIDRKIDDLAIVPVKLGKEQDSAMLFFISPDEDTSSSLDIHHELELLTQLQAPIATSYVNCMLYHQRRTIAEIQNEWLEDVSHQILAPINGIVGQAENLSRSFQKWQQIDPQRIENTLVTLTELSNWAARMASNFAWVAKDRNVVRELNLRIEDDVPGKLIGYARNVQALAKKRHLLRVHVERDTVELLNGRIRIDNKLFKQAVTNLLDNAVKYADAKTDVILSASLTSMWGLIHITNIGIAISEEDIDKIFVRGYRTTAAKHKYAVGSGIGLTIARDIVGLHGGTLTTTPSDRVAIGWKTTFSITLPLV